MSGLTAGMYGTEFDPKSHEFGLACGQMRGGIDRVVHNGGWYNKAGEKLGWGDLSQKDLVRVAKSLPVGEMFIVLYEQESFINFVQNPSSVGGSFSKVSDEESSPGQEYVADHCVYIVVPGGIYHVTAYGNEFAIATWENGIDCHTIRRKQAKSLITA